MYLHFSKSERKSTAEGIKCLKAFINNRVSVTRRTCLVFYGFFVSLPAVSQRGRETVRVFICGYVHLCVSVSVNPFFNLFVFGMQGCIWLNLLQLLVNRSTWHWWHFQVHGIKGHGHRNFVNSVVAELLKIFEPKLAEQSECLQIRFPRSWIPMSRSQECLPTEATGQQRRPSSHKCKICVIPW